jgi:DNA-binding LytR/AlgR family response regulator
LDRIIIINDNGIQNDLNHFLKANRNHIRLDSDVSELSSGGNSLINEIIESYENKYKLKIQSKDLVYIFKVNEVLYFEALYKTVKIHLTKGKPVLLEGELQTLEKQLKEYPYFAVHHDYVVNINHISSISDDLNFVVLENNVKVPVSESKKKIIITELEKYI